MSIFSGILSALGLTGPKMDRTIDINKASSTAGLKVIYGQVKVAPVSVFKFVSTNNAVYDSSADHTFTSGNESEADNSNNYDYLYRVNVWGQGKISAIENFWIDGEYSSVNRFKGKPYIRLDSLYGDENQNVFTPLKGISGKWTSAHQGRGVAYTVGRYYNDKKKPQFKSEPKLEALVNGIKLYDPRADTDQVNFSNSAVSSHISWAYSNNKALVALNYLMADYGQGVPGAEIDFPSWIIAADHCDQTIEVPDIITNTTGAPIEDYFDIFTGETSLIDIGARFPNYRPNQTQGVTELERYTSDIALDPKRSVVENMKLLLEGFGWSMPWSNGKYKLIIERLLTPQEESQSYLDNNPEYAFDEDDIIGGWQISRLGRRDRLNRCTVEFFNANKSYQDDAATWPVFNADTPVDADALIFKDEDQGQDLHTTVKVECITDHYQAQAYAEYLVRKSRVPLKIKGLKLAPRAMLLEPGDVIALTSVDRGFAGTRFIVEKVTISYTLEVAVDLLMYDGRVYGADVVQEPDNMPVSSPNLWAVPSKILGIQTKALKKTNADGTVALGLKVSWDAPKDTVGVGHIELEWKDDIDEDGHPTFETDYDESVHIQADKTKARVMNLKENTTYDFRLAYETALGQVSDYAYFTVTFGPNGNLIRSDVDLNATRNVWRGEWDGNTVYEKGDIAFYEGGTYICTVTGTIQGGAPDESIYWAPLSGEDYNDADHVVGVRGYQWPFNTSAHGWTANNAISFNQSGKKIDFIGNSGTNPYVKREGFTPFNGADIFAVRIAMKSAPGYGKQKFKPSCRYKTAAGTGFHDYDVAYRAVASKAVVLREDRYTTVIFDMHDLTTGGTDWFDKVIEGVRIDFGVKSLQGIRITGILFGNHGAGDVTGDNTALDTLNVDGVNAPYVLAGADSGIGLVSANYGLEAVVLDPTSLPVTTLNGAGVLRRAGGGNFTGDEDADYTRNNTHYLSMQDGTSRFPVDVNNIAVNNGMLALTDFWWGWDTLAGGGGDIEEWTPTNAALTQVSIYSVVLDSAAGLAGYMTSSLLDLDGDEHNIFSVKVKIESGATTADVPSTMEFQNDDPLNVGVWFSVALDARVYKTTEYDTINTTITHAEWVGKTVTRIRYTPPASELGRAWRLANIQVGRNAYAPQKTTAQLQKIVGSGVVALKDFSWGFEADSLDNDIADWTPTSSTLTQQTDHSVVLDSTAELAGYMRSAVLALDGSKYDKVEIKIKANSGTPITGKKGRFYFKVSGDTSWRPVNWIPSRRYDVDTWDIINIDMSSNVDWAGGTIIQIRFDPPDALGRAWRIASIKVGKSGTGDETSLHTAANVERVGSTVAADVESGAAAGTGLTNFDETITLDPSSLSPEIVRDGLGHTTLPVDGADVTGNNTAADTTLVAGTPAGNVDAWAYEGFELTQSGTGTQVHPDSLKDVILESDITLAGGSALKAKTSSGVIKTVIDLNASGVALFLGHGQGYTQVKSYMLRGSFDGTSSLGMDIGTPAYRIKAYYGMTGVFSTSVTAPSFIGTATGNIPLSGGYSRVGTYGVKRHYCQSGGQINTSGGTGESNSALTVFSPNNTSDAFMTFHASGAYAAYFGLDISRSGLEKWCVGGYSMGAVSYSLYHEGHKPTAAECGALATSGGGTITSGGVVFKDNVELYCGTGSDLKLVHDGANSFMSNTKGALSFYQQVNDGWMDWFVDNSSNADIKCMAVGGAAKQVYLYYNGATRLRTDSGGIYVWGAVTTGSDIDIKEQITDLDPQYCLAGFRQLIGKRYKLIAEKTNWHLGLIYQDVKKVFPDAVDFQTIDEFESELEPDHYLSKIEFGADGKPFVTEYARIYEVSYAIQLEEGQSVEDLNIILEANQRIGEEAHTPDGARVVVIEDHIRDDIYYATTLAEDLHTIKGSGCIKYAELMGPVVSAMNAQQDEIDDLKARDEAKALQIEALQNQLVDLTALVMDLTNPPTYEV